MGVGGISVGSLVVILLIVILLFGTKKLRNMGGDLGSALKNFKSAMKDEEQADAGNAAIDQKPSNDGATVDQSSKNQSNS